MYGYINGLDSAEYVLLHWGIQSILSICRFPTCKFTYLVKCICNSKVNICGVSWSFTDISLCRTVEILNHSCTHSQLRSNKIALCFLVSVLILQTSVLLWSI